MSKLHYQKLPKKWKRYGKMTDFGLCMICDKWKNTMAMIYKGDFYTICERDYYDLFGDDL